MEHEINRINRAQLLLENALEEESRLALCTEYSDFVEELEVCRTFCKQEPCKQPWCKGPPPPREDQAPPPLSNVTREGSLPVAMETPARSAEPPSTTTREARAPIPAAKEVQMFIE